jgi:hypothetical protein
MKSLKFTLTIIAVLIIQINLLYSQLYETKKYIWQRLPDLETLNSNDTSVIAYPKIYKSEKGDIYLGGRGYYTVYNRPIYRLNHLTGNWEIFFAEKSVNLDYLITQNNIMVISGIKDSIKNYLYFYNLTSDKWDTIGIQTDNNITFTRVYEYKENQYLIKSNNSANTALLLYDKNKNELKQLLPRKDSISQNDADLQIFNDIIYYSNIDRIFITNNRNAYYTDDCFKTINFAFTDKGQFNVYKQIVMTGGEYLYTHLNNFEEDYDSTSNYVVLELYTLEQEKISRKKILRHIITSIGNKKSAFNPISLMSYSKDAYIVCKLGGTSYNYAYGDTINVDSLVISEDRGNKFYYVPFPESNENYKYFTFASPAVTQNGEILLAVQPKAEDSQWATPFKIHLYYGIPDNSSVHQTIIGRNGLFPNPAYSTTRLKLQQEGQVAITAVDLLGRTFPLWSGYASTGTLELDVSALPTGSYTLLIDYGTKREAVRLMKE